MAMFANVPSVFGFSGVPGSLTPGRQAESDDYFAQLREDMARRAAMAEARKQAQSQDALGNREMTLKELLGQSQMQESRSAQQLARNRLGLDANIASNDADQRANQLSLSERLGWAGENRLSNSDAAQNALAMKRFESDQFNQDRSFTQLSAAQQADRAMQLKQLEQQRTLAEMPYNRMSMSDAAQRDFQGRQLSQQDKQFNRQFTDMPLSDRWRNALTEKQQTLDQSNADRAFNDLSARDRQSGQLEDKRMGLTERLAGNENQLRRDMQAEALRVDFDKWNGLSAAEKQQNQQFGQSLKQRLSEFQQGQQNWQTERDEPTMMQSQDLGFKQQGLDLQRKGQNEESAYRKEQGIIQREGNQMQMLAPYMEALLSGDPDARDAATAAIRKLLPNVPMTATDPAGRATMNMARAGVLKAQGGRAATTPREQSTQNLAGGQALGQMVLRGDLTEAQAEKMALEGDRQTVQGATTMRESLLETLKKANAQNKRYAEEGLRKSSPHGWRPPSGYGF